jgi:hypothetical protein
MKNFQTHLVISCLPKSKKRTKVFLSGFSVDENASRQQKGLGVIAADEYKLNFSNTFNFTAKLI